MGVVIGKGKIYSVTRCMLKNKELLEWSKRMDSTEPNLGTQKKDLVIRKTSLWLSNVVLSLVKRGRVLYV